jgi:hypothetical protein
MTLLKPINEMSMLTPYEQLFIQTFHYNGNLITEQGTGEQNPLFQLAMGHNTYVTDRYNSHTTLRPAPTLPQWRQIAVMGMYIHHYLTELIAFSAEINIISHTIVILIYL